MCAAIAVRGTELFTSSSFSYTRLALAPHFILYPFYPSIFPFRLRLIHALPSFFFFFTFSAHSVFCCCLFFFLPCSSSSHSSSISQPPHPPTPPFLLSVSPLLSLSLSSTVSPEASLSHHSSSFINTCTHTAQHTQLPHISVHCPHKHTYTHPRARALPTAHMSPRTQGAQCVHTLAPAYCAEKCPL